MLDEATARAIAILLTALGVPALLFSLGRSLWKWWTGRAGRERARNNDLVTKLRRAEEEREREAREKRQALEYASRLRRQLIEQGIEPAEWPSNVGAGPRKEEEERRIEIRRPARRNDSGYEPGFDDQSF